MVRATARSIGQADMESDPIIRVDAYLRRTGGGPGESNPPGTPVGAPQRF